MNAKVVFLITCLLFPLVVLADPFVNLDFESATLVRTPNAFAVEYEAGPALPGWTLGGDSSTIFDVSQWFNQGRRPVVYMVTPNSGSGGISSLISGNYSISMPNYNSGGIRPVTAITLSQSGTVPIDAQSLNFYASIGLTDGTPAGAFTVYFAGNPLSLVELADQGAYKIYGADMSGFAGTSGELKFELTTGYWGSYATLDQISFSPLAVPEPATIGIFASGLIAFAGAAARRRWCYDGRVK